MLTNDGRVVSNFIVQALNGEKITIYGDGTQTRSFCYVVDMVDAFMRFMDTEPEITGPINLGNPNEFTILELAEKVITLTNSSSEIQYLPLPPDDPKQRQPDISQANEKLNWEASIELGTGLKYTVPYFKEVINQM
jgi:UDP-glucuronate decarboxylase